MILAQLLLDAFRRPPKLPNNVQGWNLLLRLARQTHLLGRLATHLQPLADFSLPAKVHERLTGTLLVGTHRRMIVSNEVRRIEKALSGLAVPIIALKGAAYQLGGFPFGLGRNAADIDILVPKSRLDEVEVALLQNGWEFMSNDTYDHHYYRQWTHELPPLIHVQSHIVLDVHHNILPPKGAYRIDADRLIARSEPLQGSIRRLCRPDMILHSAVHLFQEGGSFSGGLRGLLDLYQLLEWFHADSEFTPDLLARAEELGLQRPLFYAIRYVEQLFGHQEPELRAKLKSFAPSRVSLWWMDHALTAAVLPDAADGVSWNAQLAQQFLFWRYQWIRMPKHILVWHVLHKYVFSMLRPRMSG